jgi:hypothetical protein
MAGFAADEVGLRVDMQGGKRAVNHNEKLILPDFPLAPLTVYDRR